MVATSNPAPLAAAGMDEIAAKSSQDSVRVPCREPKDLPMMRFIRETMEVR